MREVREPYKPLGRVGERKKKRIFSVSPQYRSLFSASLQAFCLTVCAYLNTQKYGLFCSLIITWYLFYGENSSWNRQCHVINIKKAPSYNRD